MIQIPRHILQQIRQTAEDSYPEETCGFIATPVGSLYPMRLVPMRNAAPGAARVGRYEYDPQQQLEQWREMDRNGEMPVILYHTHPVGPPTPSHDDRQAMTLHPGSLHLILGVGAYGQPLLQCYRYCAGMVITVPVEEV